MIKNMAVVGVSAMLVAASSMALADEHVVEAVITQFRPMVTFAKPGDTIRFKSMAGHDTATLEGMIPAGATPWQAKLGEEGFTVTVDKEGVWIYKCNPHMTTGMVGVIVVGDTRPPANLKDLETALPNVKVGRNMVNRAINKLKQALDSGKSPE